MKRTSPRVVAVAGALALTASALLIPTTSQAALPAPDLGGPAELLRYEGDPSSATGNALSNGECDVNGDTFADGVVGAWFWDKTPINNIGAAYVLLGSKDARGVPLADPGAANAIRIDGPSVTPSNSVGFAVACLGDVDDDGYDDLAISNYIAQQAYVIFGAKDFTALTLDSLGDRGFAVKGEVGVSGNVSYSMSPAGDLNDDGFDDFAIAEIAADTQGRTNNGRIWVVAGRDDISDVNLLSPDPGQILMTVDGAANEERLSASAKAGDVNGDGIDDFLLGSYVAAPWGASVAATGAAYVVYGRTAATGTIRIDTADLGTAGFTVRGPQRQRDRLGVSVAAAGDLNQDGLADLLIGADGVNNAVTGPRTGGAAVVFGAASQDTVYTDPAATNGQSVFTCPAAETPGACATPTRRGYWINGVNNQDSVGYSVAGLGDVNGDTVPDLAIGAYGYDPVNPADPISTLSGAGATYVVQGRPNAVVQELSALTEADGYRIDGLRAGDRFGRQVGTLGDFDGNGTNDFYIGGDFSQRPIAAPQAQAGEVTVALLGKLNVDVALSGPTTVHPGEEATFVASLAKPAGAPAAVTDGTVSFLLDGAPIGGCADLAIADESATCGTTRSTEVAGQVTAAYSGTSTLKASTSPAADFAVTRRSATLDLGPVAALTYGQRAGTITGSLSGAIGVLGATPTGAVTVSAGGTSLGSATLANGAFTLRLRATALKPGNRTLSVTYAGDPNYAATTRTLVVKVKKATATITAKPVRSTVKVGKRTVLKIKVKAPGAPISGRVTIRVGGKVIKRIKLTGGNVRVALPKATGAGVRKVKVRYLGSTTVKSATATTVRIKDVRR